MHPVQHFKTNFVQPTQEELAAPPQGIRSPVGVELHEADSLVRNVCFVWEDGRKAFFNYAYLVSVELLVNDSTNVLLLCFGSDTVIVKGHRLSLLFDLLIDHQPKIITATNPRYFMDTKQKGLLVTDLTIKSE